VSAFGHRHLLGIEPLAAADIETILTLSERFLEIAERPIKKVPTLRGKTVINLFLEPSTRTRTSFEIAAKRLSADASSLRNAWTVSMHCLTIERLKACSTLTAVGKRSGLAAQRVASSQTTSSAATMTALRAAGRRQTGLERGEGPRCEAAPEGSRRGVLAVR